MKLKKYLGLILVIAMILSVATVPASAAAYITSADLTVTVPVTGSIVSKNVRIPDNSDYEVVQVAWKDIDEGRVLSDGESFKAGHVYMLGISMKTLGGKVFSEERSTITVNGGKTDWYTIGEAEGIGETAIIYHTFPKTTVDFAANLPISGVAAPVVEDSPDWNVSCDWDGAVITAMGWQCVENGKTVFSNSDQSVKDEFVFKAGYTYKAAFAVEIKDGYELYGFFSATVNGEQASGKWSLEGKTAVVEYTFPKLPEEDVRIPGDVNTDTKVNLTDASLMLKHIAGWDVALDPFAADVNADYKINLSDVSLVLKHIAGWDVILK